MAITSTFRRGLYLAAALAVTSVMLATLAACRRTESAPPAPAFPTPDAAVIALAKAVKGGNLAEVMAIFGPDAQALVDTSDPVTARRNQQVFSVAFSEYWRVVPAGLGRATLMVGFEEWPFPIPLVKEGGEWRFDTAAGREEILARRIGRNELAAIRICRAYVGAQRRYARYGHDGKPAGIYATAFRSDPARENGLYWQARRGQRRSPLGDLLAAASIDTVAVARRASNEGPQPFHGYYFRILTAQGPAASGGARDYVVNGKLTGGFALVAWPAQYDVTGIVTFVVNQDGVVFERDLGPDTEAAARAISTYNPDSSWAASH
jgi:Protein of unknown function (DUF2950)